MVETYGCSLSDSPSLLGLKYLNKVLFIYLFIFLVFRLRFILYFFSIYFYLLEANYFTIL